jgi:hypothetical protein
MNSLPSAIPDRYRPPLKTNMLAGLQLLGRFRGKDLSAVHYTFSSLVGKIMQSGLLYF